MSILFARMGQGSGAGGGIEIIQGSRVADPANGTIFTHAHTWGAIGSGRVLLVTLSTITNQAGTNALSVSIAGIPCTRLILKSQSGGGGSSCSEIWAAYVPTGTAGNVVVTMNTGQFNCTTAVFTLYNVNSLTPTFTGSFGQSSGTVQTVPNCTVSPGGVILATGCANTTAAWTGFAPLTQIGVSGVVEASLQVGTAWDLAGDFSGPASVTLTNASCDRQTLVVASLR